VNKAASLLPPPLRPGDGISVIAPASPFDPDKLHIGLSMIEQMGFRPVFNDDLFQSAGYLAGSDQRRAAAFNEAFSHEQTSAVWCVRGGYGALRILPFIDYQGIRSRPKILIGCSDITAILHAIGLRCGMATFHGPMLASLFHALPSTMDALTRLFQWQANYTAVLETPVPIHPGSATGKLSGGNLTTLCHLIGTPWHPQFSGCLLFLEDRGEAPYRIDRMLTQMKLAGCFEGLAGLVLGSFEKCGTEPEIYRIVTGIFSDIDIPILAGFPAGHGEPNIILPMGITARLNADAGSLICLESPVAWDEKD
jgi:muramoyltetrapeptide carboxypeptidase